MFTVFGRAIGRFRSCRAAQSVEEPKPSRKGAPIVPTEVRASIGGGALLLLDTGRGLIFKANSTGARIWQGLVEGQSIPALAQQLSEQYGVAPERTARDIDRFLADLRDNGLLTAAHQG